MPQNQKLFLDSLGSDLSRVDTHVIQPNEYEELPELTDEILARGIKHEKLRREIQTGLDQLSRGESEDGLEGRRLGWSFAETQLPTKTAGFRSSTQPTRLIDMITDTEIKQKGFEILSKHLGDMEAERFIALIQRGRFDYTKWRQELDEELSLEEISRNAMALRNQAASA